MTNSTPSHLFRTVSVLPSRELLTQCLSIFKEEVEAIKTVEGLAPNFITYPLQKNAIDAMKQRGGNALGIDQDGPLFGMCYHNRHCCRLTNRHPSDSDILGLVEC